MSVLSKEEFMNQLRTRIGDDNSEEAIAFMENLTDTYEDLERKSQLAEDTVPRQELEEANEKWAKKYKDRFCNTGVPEPAPDKKDTHQRVDLKIDDLFK